MNSSTHRRKPGSHRSSRRFLKSTNSSQEHESYLPYTMDVEYRKIQKNSSNQALLVSLPSDFVQTIPLQKSDVVKMQLMKDNSIRLEKV